MNDMMQTLSDNKVVRVAAIAVLILLALFLLVKTIDSFDEIGRSDSPMLNTITVSGEGRATAVPDIARITFTVMETAPSVVDAQKKATERNDQALAAVKELGVEDKDVRTLSYNVSPQYDYSTGRACMAGMPCGPIGNPTISGYQVMQTVEVKVRETEKASEVLGKLGGLGVQNINGPDFALDDPEEVKAEAREEAIGEAREEAKRLAKQLGVRLGKVVSYMDNQSHPYPMYGYGGSEMDSMSQAKAAPMPASPTLPMGENEFVSNVSITYEIR